jgi:hypothetical protein
MTFLYFFPDPQGHGSFRPTLAVRTGDAAALVDGTNSVTRSLKRWSRGVSKKLQGSFSAS